jgi:hypothetical protein
VVNTSIGTSSGQSVRLADGSRVLFGRGPAVDLVIGAGRGLSRRAGMVMAMPAGAWIANMSRTHALYVEGEGYRTRLPPTPADGEPPYGWFVHVGTAFVGSRSMLDDRQPLIITVTGVRGGGQVVQPEGDGTILPLYLDPMTKLFLVALMWCRPLLLDPSGSQPLLRTPEIARAALETTGAYHELERFEADPQFRDRLSARVAEHIKVLRRKIVERGLAGSDVRLSDEVAVRILIDHGIVTAADLTTLNDPAWCSRQEDLWWTED